MTAQGHPRATFNQAIERGNLLVAETIAREMGAVSLGEALELVALIAQHDTRRHGRAGKDGEYDRSVQKRLGSRRRTRL